MSAKDYAILDEQHRVVPADMMEWARMFEDITRRRVAFTDFGNGVTVSTVFLGMDHGFGGPSLWFESMVFGLPHSDEYEIQERYETWDEAVAGHAALVEKYKPPPIP